MEAPVRLCCFLVVVCLYIERGGVQADITVQGLYDCGSYREPKEIFITDRNDEIITSQSQEHYASDRNCILVLIGKKNYQIELELMNIDIDTHAYVTEACGGLCCNDFIKIFNSYRVDNARLLPGTSQWGMCGQILPTKILFQTTQNFVTIQFKTDRRIDYKTGFTMRFRQFPWRHPGNILPDGGLYGGWNDGSRNVLQVDWSDQSQIPGGYLPDESGPDYDKEDGGSKCYECSGCDLEFFRPNLDGATIQAGCYVCSKSWRDDFASAQRVCYTKLQYNNLLLQLIDSTVPGGKAQEFRGCKRFLDAYSIPRNYCICDKDLCNSGNKKSVHIFAIIVVTLAFLL